MTPNSMFIAANSSKLPDISHTLPAAHFEEKKERKEKYLVFFLC
jgi:hypothetical protein